MTLSLWRDHRRGLDMKMERNSNFATVLEHGASSSWFALVPPGGKEAARCSIWHVAVILTRVAVKNRRVKAPAPEYTKPMAVLYSAAACFPPAICAVLQCAGRPAGAAPQGPLSLLARTRGRLGDGRPV